MPKEKKIKKSKRYKAALLDIRAAVTSLRGAGLTEVQEFEHLRIEEALAILNTCPICQAAPGVACFADERAGEYHTLRITRTVVL